MSRDRGRTPTPKPKRFILPPPVPPWRRPFRAGDPVRLREHPETIGQVIIPASVTLAISGRPARVKVNWVSASGFLPGTDEWIDEAKLMAIDTITELGRLA